MNDFVALSEKSEKGLFHAREFLISQALPQVMKQTADFVDSLNDDVGVKFRIACEFMRHDLEDAFSASLESFERCGFFPFSELAYEFDAFQTLLLQGNYKHTRDSMRRILDVGRTAVMFLVRKNCGKEASDWVCSKGKTPSNAKSLKELKENPLAAQLDKKLGFIEALNEEFGELSNYCHSRGIEFSTGSRHGNQSECDGVIMPRFQEDECRKVMREFCIVVGLLAVLLVVHNPMLLVPIDKEVKWGMDGPISGFFSSKQVDDLHSVMPSGYAKWFRTFGATDQTVVALHDYFEALPDINEEEIRLQADEINKEMNG